MTVETALYPSQFNTSLPTAADMVSEGDDHLRLIKIVDKTTWSNVAGAVLASHIELNYSVGVTGPIQTQINGKGAINGQTWTGAHVFGGSIAVPTLAQATSTTGAASTAFVQNEWTTRLPNYTGPITASTAELNRVAGVTSPIQTQIDSKGAIAGQTWAGTHVFPNTTTVGPLTPTIQGYLATATSDIQDQINARSRKAGETYAGSHDFTGATSVTVPTLAAGTTGNGAVSADMLNAAAFSGALPGQAGSAGKGVTTDGANASWAWFNAPLTVLITNTTPVTAVPGTFYIFTVAGGRLNIPAGFVNGDTIGWGMSRGVASAEVNFGTYNCKGRSPGVMTMSNQNQSVTLRLRNSTDGFMEGA